MMTNKLYPHFCSLILLSLVLLSACSSDKKSESENGNKATVATGKERYEQLIDSIEAKMQATRNMPLDQGTAMFAMRVYDEYASYVPDEQKSPDYLFKAGELANSMQLSQPALGYFTRLTNKYPSYKNTPYAIFMQGMIYDDQLKDTAGARKMYKQVIEKFPNTQLAKDAETSIGHLGKSVEELVREFEQKNAAAAKN